MAPIFIAARIARTFMTHTSFQRKDYFHSGGVYSKQVVKLFLMSVLSWVTFDTLDSNIRNNLIRKPISSSKMLLSFILCFAECMLVYGIICPSMLRFAFIWPKVLNRLYVIISYNGRTLAYLSKASRLPLLQL